MAKLGDVVGMPVHSEPQRDANLVLPYGKVGIEIETEGWKGDGAGTLPKVWEFHQDGSLRNNGMEFTTRGNGIVGTAITSAVQGFCTWAKARKLDVGYPRAGIHVHLDCTDLDFEAGHLHNLVAMYLLVEHAMYGYAGEWRRTCGFCDPLSESQLPMNQLRHALFAADSNGKSLPGRLNKLGRYYGLNVKALNKIGTLEFRQLETTFDPERILNWINIIFQLKRAAMEWPQGRRILVEVSRSGAREFARTMMGKQWDHISQWFEEDRLWAAVDAAIIMMEGQDDENEADWGEVAPSNPILEKKGPKPAKKKTLKEELYAEMIQAPNVEDVMVGFNDHQAHLNAVQRAQLQMLEAQRNAAMAQPRVNPRREVRPGQWVNFGNIAVPPRPR